MPEIPDADSAVRAAIRHWRRLPELPEFAARRHGYGDSDGGFGVTYPSDLDEYDREVEGQSIPDGHVQVYGFWGPPDGYEVVVPEAVYLDILAAVLTDAGLADQAGQVRAVRGPVAADYSAALTPRWPTDVGG